MRKVSFKKWIPIAVEDDANGNPSKVSSSGRWEDGFTGEGYFHGFGVATETVGDTIASFSIALIEDKEGKVHEQPIPYMNFIINGHGIES